MAAKLEELLSDPLLDPDVVADFRRQCERVAARHSGWRRNFPAFSGLLDTDVERAHALAGNYATEGRETVGVWLAVQQDQGDDWSRRRPVEELQQWIEAYLAAWREQVLVVPDVAALEGGPRERFLLILDDLLERGRAEAAAYVGDAAAGPRSRKGGMALIAWPIRALARAVRRFFDPTV